MRIRDVSHQNIFLYSAMFISTALASISIMASREKARQAGMSNTYKMEQTLVYVGAFVALMMALVVIFFLIHARYYHGSHGSDVGVLAANGVGAAICAYVWSMYQVRFDDTGLRLGLYARTSLPYASIEEICEIRGQGSPRANLVTTSGRVVRIWSNLVGFDSVMNQLRSRCPNALFRTTGPIYGGSG